MAKKKTTKASRERKAIAEAFDVGPEVSPYKSPGCKVYFKSGQPSVVPRDIICASVELDRICSSFNEIRITDVPDEAGHVLVHYLHTGTWQTLRNGHLLHDSKISTQFETSVHVYTAAQAYGLPDLAEIAKEHISRFAESLPALDVIVLAASACGLLPDDDLWFSAFIKMRIEDLFEDPDSLNQPVFLACFDAATTYSKMLVKSMVQICCEKSAFGKSAESNITPEPEAESEPEPEPAYEAEAEPAYEAEAEPAYEAEPEPAYEAEPEPVGEPKRPYYFDPEPATEAAIEVPAEHDVASLTGSYCGSLKWRQSAAHPEEPPEAAEPTPEPEQAASDALAEFPVPTKKSKKKEKKSKKAKKPGLTCEFATAHIVEDRWEDCPVCRKFVGVLSARYGSITNVA
ncbi:hypothetical protein EsH8_VIII_000959 [Colletotrichum jinshuiense]